MRRALVLLAWALTLAAAVFGSWLLFVSIESRASWLLIASLWIELLHFAALIPGWGRYYLEFRPGINYWQCLQDYGSEFPRWAMLAKLTLWLAPLIFISGVVVLSAQAR